MSNQCLEVQKLEEKLRQVDEEKRALQIALEKARWSAENAPAPSDYQTVSPSDANDHVFPESTTQSLGLHGLQGLGLAISQTSQHLMQARPMKRSKTVHPYPHTQAQPVKMARSNSAISSAPKSNPFSATSTKPITPPCVPSHRKSVPNQSSMLDDYLNSQYQQPATALMYGDALLNSHPRRQIESLAECGREMEIDEFLKEYGDTFVQPTSPMGPSTLLSPHDASTTAVGIASNCGSLTSGPTLGTSPMTRCDSNGLTDNASISGQFQDMVRIQSQQSTKQERQGSYSQHHSVNHLKRRSVVEPGMLEIEVNFQEHFAHPYPSSAPSDSLLSQHLHLMEKSESQLSLNSTSSLALREDLEYADFITQHTGMERSASQDSMRSASSLKLRAKEALNRQIHAARTRQIQPKPPSEETNPEPDDSPNTKAKGKTAIAKAKKYQRPKHDRVTCKQCNDHPEGFRGEHELRRHIEAKHNRLVKKWICRDPATVGFSHQERAIKPLSECKQCLQQKQYGAYYNAAAHLRRTHFRHKKSRKGKNSANSGSKEKEEKRGGNGGGDWPPMTELKQWMVEIMVPIDQPGALASDLLDGLESVGHMETEDIELNMEYLSHPAMVADPFDLSQFAGVGSGFAHDTLDASLLQGDLNSYPIDPAVFVNGHMSGVPISSSGFDMTSSVDHAQQHHVQAAMISMEAGSYCSTGSSPSTVTPATVHGHILPPATMLARDDLPDLPFEMTFHQ